MWIFTACVSSISFLWRMSSCEAPRASPLRLGAKETYTITIKKIPVVQGVKKSSSY